MNAAIPSIPGEPKRESRNRPNSDPLRRGSSAEEKDKIPRNSIDILPDDLLLTIFDYLPIRVRTTCELVNRQWYNLITRSWKSIQRLSFKTTFELWNASSSCTTEHLSKILSKCPNVKSLDFNLTAVRLNLDAFPMIGHSCPKLEELILHDPELDKQSVVELGKYCPNLRILDLTKCNNINEPGIGKLFHHRPNLERLSLGQCGFITGQSFNKLTSLTYLDLQRCRSIVPEAFTNLAQNCSFTLQTLLAPDLSSESLAIICQSFPNLEYFVVETASGSLSGAAHLSQLRNLQVLRFTPALMDLTNDSFHMIISNLPKLTELYLYGTDAVTDQSGIEIPDCCPNLEKFSLEGAKISDLTLRSLSRLPNLNYLNVSGALITDDIAEIISHLPKLEFFDVNQCPAISLQTLKTAWDLVKEGVANENLIIFFNYNRIRIREVKSKEELIRFAGPCGVDYPSDDEDLYDGDLYDDYFDDDNNLELDYEYREDEIDEEDDHVWNDNPDDIVHEEWHDEHYAGEWGWNSDDEDQVEDEWHEPDGLLDDVNDFEGENRPEVPDDHWNPDDLNDNDPDLHEDADDRWDVPDEHWNHNDHDHDAPEEANDPWEEQMWGEHDGYFDYNDPNNYDPDPDYDPYI